MSTTIGALGIGAVFMLVACTAQPPVNRPSPTTASATTPTVTTTPTGAPASSPSAQATHANSGLPPSGTWQVELTADDLTRAGWPADVTPPGTYTWIFDGDRATLELDADDGSDVQCEAEMEAAADGVRLTYEDGACGGEVDDIRWELNGEELHLAVITTNAPLDQQKAYLETDPWLPIDSE